MGEKTQSDNFVTRADMRNYWFSHMFEAVENEKLLVHWPNLNDCCYATNLVRLEKILIHFKMINGIVLVAIV